MTQAVRRAEFSRIKEAVATWGKIRQLLRSGDNGQLVPVVIPKDRRGFGWLYLMLFGVYLLGMAVFAGNAGLRVLAGGLGVLVILLALLRLWAPERWLRWAMAMWQLACWATRV